MKEKFWSELDIPKHPCLGPNVWGMKKSVFFANPANNKISYLALTIHFLAFLFVVTQYVELWIIRNDINSAMRNLSITMLASICVVKAYTYTIWSNHWIEIINAVSEDELITLKKRDEKSNEIMRNYVKYSKSVTVFYWGLVLATCIVLALKPFLAYMSSAKYRELIQNGTEPFPEIMSSWLPLDKTRGIGYWVYYIEHFLILMYGGTIIGVYDSTAVALMTYFSGNFELLKIDCERIFGDGKDILSDELAMKNIKKCHKKHIFLIKYSRLMNSMLSPVLFLYVIICSLMICASALQLTKTGTSRMQQLWIAEYLVALVAQLFLYCWHGNEVLFKSMSVDRGVYDSKWWARNVYLRKCILLLGGQLNKTIVFTAGPFTTLTVAAFVTIMKGSYSYYAIVSKNAD